MKSWADAYLGGNSTPASKYFGIEIAQSDVLQLSLTL